ncbi:MAG: RtcB family protein [Lentisphaerae bacterium]|nr:RtcB family protein [Lentisphaerota bacterium]
MKWIKQDETLRIPIKSWCESIEDGALQQAIDLARHPVVEHHVALMPDCHVGYGMPIGGVIAAKNAMLPSAVGVDIGCGMIAVQTNIPAERLAEVPARRAIQEKLKARIPVGEGVAHKQQQAWEGFERYLDTNGAVCDFPNALDRRNLGTLGGGNHFIELQKSDTGFIWLMIHSGSRNLGQRVEKHYQAKAKKLNEAFKAKLPNPVLAFLPIETKEGQDYFRDMTFALEYALENRRRMMLVFKETLAEAVPETEFLREVNIHHNYAALESHFGENLYIHRKGATSAKKDETGIIPGSMGTASYIVRGLGNPESFMSCSHGAGRTMSRTAASANLTLEECNAAMEGIVFERWSKYKGFDKRHKGRLDLSEAPQAYKPIDEVIAAQSDLVEPIVRLMPLAVLKG